LSATYTIPTADHIYTVVDDCVTTYSAVITGAVTDEIVGAFDDPGFTVQLVRSDLQSKTTERGLYAVAAYPAKSFPELTTRSYTVSYTLVAPGFRDMPITVALPAGATLPVPAPIVAMRRFPVRIQGRVVHDSTGLPAAGLHILCVDNPNPPSPPPPPPLPRALLLRSPMYFAHAAASPVQQASLTVTGTAQLTLPASVGATSIQLNSTAGLGGTSAIQLSSSDLTRMEYATVATIGPQPGLVNLRVPLNRSYASGVTTHVQFVTPSLTGPVGHLLTDSNIGDGILIADRLFQVSTLAIGSGAAIEYHEMGALTNVDGYYAADGVGRTAEIFLRPNPGTPGLPVVSWVIEYDHAVNVVNFRI